MATQSCRNALACHRCSPAKGIYRVSSAFNSIASQVVRRHRRGGSWGKLIGGKRQVAKGQRAMGRRCSRADLHFMVLWLRPPLQDFCSSSLSPLKYHSHNFWLQQQQQLWQWQWERQFPFLPSINHK